MVRHWHLSYIYHVRSARQALHYTIIHDMNNWKKLGFIYLTPITCTFNIGYSHPCRQLAHRCVVFEYVYFPKCAWCPHWRHDSLYQCIICSSRITPFLPLFNSLILLLILPKTIIQISGTTSRVDRILKYIVGAVIERIRERDLNARPFKDFTFHSILRVCDSEVVFPYDMRTWWSVLTSPDFLNRDVWSQMNRSSAKEPQKKNWQC